MLVEELEVGAGARRQGWFAAADDHGPDEQLAFVDQACCEGAGGQVGPADGEVAGGCGLQFLDGAGVEVAFEAGGSRRHGGQGRGVDDLVGCLPARRSRSRP